ncbi:MAG: glycosyl hydrolase 53 family protein [Cytophagia bacterium]|nr:glycosyl hydrolase 53 family protein [Cytophagia bacterium]
MKISLGALILILLISCSKDSNTPTLPDEGNGEIIGAGFYHGADLSYVNEMEDCGAVYEDFEGNQKDPYQIFSEAGTNLVRLRLWHNPDWTDYSIYEDVKKSIGRAKQLGIDVLLDFHYSDDWADPSKQEIPAEWLPYLDDTPKLVELIYDYTYSTLENLSNENLLPEIVQVGNEINPMILQEGDLEWPINWNRNAALLNSGIKAIRDISVEKGKEIEVMLHIAQPENGLWWFEQANANGVTDYDWIGLSYYPIWSEYDLDDVGIPLKTLVDSYNKKLMVVETAYPWTMQNADGANNILGTDALISGYPASPQGQLDYLNRLKEEIHEAGGSGLIYWEPAWVSTNCSTQWAQGSHWDNATMFNFSNRATIALNFYNATLED